MDLNHWIKNSSDTLAHFKRFESSLMHINCPPPKPEPKSLGSIPSKASFLSAPMQPCTDGLSPELLLLFWGVIIWGVHYFWSAICSASVGAWWGTHYPACPRFPGAHCAGILASICGLLPVAAYHGVPDVPSHGNLSHVRGAGPFFGSPNTGHCQLTPGAEANGTQIPCIKNECSMLIASKSRMVHGTCKFPIPFFLFTAP